MMQLDNARLHLEVRGTNKHRAVVVAKNSNGIISLRPANNRLPVEWPYGAVRSMVSRPGFGRHSQSMGKHDRTDSVEALDGDMYCSVVNYFLWHNQIFLSDAMILT